MERHSYLSCLSTLWVIFFRGLSHWSCPCRGRMIQGTRLWWVRSPKGGRKLHEWSLYYTGCVHTMLTVHPATKASAVVNQKKEDEELLKDGKKTADGRDTLSCSRSRLAVNSWIFLTLRTNVPPFLLLKMGCVRTSSKVSAGWYPFIITVWVVYLLTR